MSRIVSIAAIVTLVLATMSGAALAQEKNCGPELNYEDADIRSVVDEIAVRTGRTFLLDPAVQGRVTIKSPPNGGICADEAWALFQAVLRVNDFTATPIADGKYKIVPIQDAARSGGRVSGDRATGDDFVTEIVRLQFIDAREAAANLAQIIGDNGVVSPVRSGNALILVDTARNVVRLKQVLGALDKDQTIYRTIALKYASAADVARVISDLAREISEDNSAAGGSFSVVPVEASNSILIRADPDLMRRLQSVVAELDQFGQNTSEISVVYLSHANAEDLAPILTEVANNGPVGPEGEATGGARAKITFHGPTNAIIINGGADIQRTLHNVIGKLDIRRPQVLVEAIIVDVSDTLARDLGVEFFLSGSGENGVPFTSTNFSWAPNTLAAAGSALLRGEGFGTGLNDEDRDALASEFAATALDSLLGVNGLALGGGVDLGGGNIFGGILTAVQNDTDSNVLSTPSVMTLDNQTARLQVGQEIPITTGEAIGDNFSNAFRTVNREQVGVILEVTPQINEGDSVTLEIVQEISSIAGPITASSTDLITNKREISTTALIDDGNILVIGGLISDERSQQESKVPFLGDIPGLGNLFKQTSRERRRQNLMVFIRPTIIRDKQTARSATRKKLDYMRARDLLTRGGPQSDLDRLIEQVTGVDAPLDDQQVNDR